MALPKFFSEATKFMAYLNTIQHFTKSNIASSVSNRQSQEPPYLNQDILQGYTITRVTGRRQHGNLNTENPTDDYDNTLIPDESEDKCSSSSSSSTCHIMTEQELLQRMKNIHRRIDSRRSQNFSSCSHNLESLSKSLDRFSKSIENYTKTLHTKPNCPFGTTCLEASSKIEQHFGVDSKNILNFKPQSCGYQIRNYGSDDSEHSCTGKCDGKPPKYRQPCAGVCDDDEDKDEFVRKEVKDRCQSVCDEWKKKRGFHQAKSICPDLKCMKHEGCGLEKTSISADCKNKPIKKEKKECPPKPPPPCRTKICPLTEPEQDCATPPPPYRYKSINPRTYLDVKPCQTRQVFMKPCGLVPPTEEEKELLACMTETREKKCRMKKKSSFKGGKHGKCQVQSWKCCPIKVVKKDNKCDSGGKRKK